MYQNVNKKSHFLKKLNLKTGLLMVDYGLLKKWIFLYKSGFAEKGRFTEKALKGFLDPEIWHRTQFDRCIKPIRTLFRIPFSSKKGYTAKKSQ